MGGAELIIDYCEDFNLELSCFDYFIIWRYRYIPFNDFYNAYQQLLKWQCLYYYVHVPSIILNHLCVFHLFGLYAFGADIDTKCLQ